MYTSPCTLCGQCKAHTLRCTYCKDSLWLWNCMWLLTKSQFAGALFRASLSNLLWLLLHKVQQLRVTAVNSGFVSQQGHFRRKTTVGTAGEVEGWWSCSGWFGLWELLKGHQKHLSVVYKLCTQQLPFAINCVSSHSGLKRDTKIECSSSSDGLNPARIRPRWILRSRFFAAISWPEHCIVSFTSAFVELSTFAPLYFSFC